MDSPKSQTSSLTIELQNSLSLSLSLSNPKANYRTSTLSLSLSLSLSSTFATRMEARNEYRKGLWTVEEDRILMDHIRVHGKGKWNRIAKTTGIYIYL